MSNVLKLQNRKILWKSNNEKSYQKGGKPMKVTDRYKNGKKISPLSNPEIPMKNPMTKDPKTYNEARKTYQSGFKRKGCGGILKKKGCGGMLYTKKCGGGKIKG